MAVVKSFSLPPGFPGYEAGVSVELTATIHTDATSGTPLADEPVSFAVVSPSSGVTLNPTTRNTGTDGLAKTTLTCTSGVSGPVTVKATVSGDPLGNNLTLSPKPAQSDQIEISVNPDQLPNGDNYYLAQVGTAVQARVSNSDTGEVVADDTKVSWTVSLPADSYLLIPDESSTKNGIATTTLKLTKKLASTVTNFTVTAKSATAPDADAVINIAQTVLAAPIVINADEGDGFILDEAEIEAGVTAVIPGPVVAGETYTLYWSDNAGAEPVKTSTFAQNSNSLAFNIDRYAAKAFTDGRHGVFYTIKENSGNVEYSKSIAVTVVGSTYTPETLPRPSIPAAEDNNDAIGTGNSQGDVQVIVRYPDITPTDTVTLFWNAYSSTDQPIKIASTTLVRNPPVDSSQMAFKIPHQFLYPYPDGVGVQNGFVNCYYVVEQADGTTARSHTYRIRLDTVDG